MNDAPAEIRAAAEARVDAIYRAALAERAWLTAIYFRLARRSIVAAAIRSRESGAAPEKKSPFVYDMR
jgi:hypothetical protein